MVTVNSTDINNIIRDSQTSPTFFTTDTAAQVKDSFGPTAQKAASGPNGTSGTKTDATQSKDMRVRLMSIVGQESKIYGPQDDTNVLSILYNTMGVLFPYTPSISVNQSVDYKSAELVHTNGDIFTYSRTPSVSLTINGKFTVQNQREGQYAVAVLHFLRTVSKMHFGQNDALAGLPPPVLILRGYGNMMFNDLKVFVKSHSYTLEDSVDYVDVKTAGLVARVPALFSVAVELNVMQTPQAMRTKFSLDDFRTGKLMLSQTGWF